MVNNPREIYLKMGGLEKWLSVFVILGAGVAAIGLLRGVLLPRKIEVEYIKNTSATKELIVVDIEGAVNKPGVYEFSAGSRIKDVLVRAEGYSSNADRGYCEKNINLASPLKDGQKIYIPLLDDTRDVLGYSEAKTGGNLININTASASELDTLWGIGEVRIDNIVKNRPYESVDDLVVKKVFTKQILEKNKDRVTVY